MPAEPRTISAEPQAYAEALRAAGFYYNFAAFLLDTLARQEGADWPAGLARETLELVCGHEYTYMCLMVQVGHGMGTGGGSEKTCGRRTGWRREKADRDCTKAKG